MEESGSFTFGELDKVSEVFDKAYVKSYRRVMNDDLYELLNDVPEVYKGFQLWLEVLLFSTASIMNSRKKRRRSSKPTDVVKQLIATKNPGVEPEELWAIFTERLKDFSEVSRTKENDDWMAFFYTCLVSYSISEKNYVDYVVRSIGANKIAEAQGEVTRDFIKLWKKL